MTSQTRPTNVDKLPITSDVDEAAFIVQHERQTKKLKPGAIAAFVRKLILPMVEAATAAAREAERAAGNVGKDVAATAVGAVTAALSGGDAGLAQELRTKVMAMAASVGESGDPTFTPTLAMNATVQVATHATGVAVTLPNNLPKGFTMGLIQGGEGQLTFAAAAGATMKQVDGATKSRKIDAFRWVFLLRTPPQMR